MPSKKQRAKEKRLNEPYKEKRISYHLCINCNNQFLTSDMIWMQNNKKLSCEGTSGHQFLCSLCYQNNGKEFKIHRAHLRKQNEQFLLKNKKHLLEYNKQVLLKNKALGFIPQ